MAKVIRAGKSTQEPRVWFESAWNNSALTPDNSGAARAMSRGDS